MDDLTSRIRAGDRTAFRSLVCREQDRLVRVAMRTLGDRESALDSAQEAFIRLWRARETLDPHLPVEAFLLRTLRNYCIDQSRGSRPAPSAIREDEPSLEALPEEISENRILADAVREAVLCLPEQQRSVFILNHYEGLSYAEVGRLLECPVGTVASRKQAAVFALRRKLAGWRDE